MEENMRVQILFDVGDINDVRKIKTDLFVANVEAVTSSGCSICCDFEVFLRDSKFVVDSLKIDKLMMYINEHFQAINKDYSELNLRIRCVFSPGVESACMVLPAWMYIRGGFPSDFSRFLTPIVDIIQSRCSELEKIADEWKAKFETVTSENVRINAELKMSKTTLDGLSPKLRELYYLKKRLGLNS
jgi:hypothetical protein